MTYVTRMDPADAAAEMRREDEAYRKAVRSMSPSRRRAWARVEEAHEWFDGESAIAHASLVRWLKARSR